MAGNDEGRQIVRTETDPNGGTGEGQIYVCADGSRWQATLHTTPGTAKTFGHIKGNRIEPE